MVVDRLNSSSPPRQLTARWNPKRIESIQEQPQTAHLLLAIARLQQELHTVESQRSELAAQTQTLRKSIREAARAQRELLPSNETVSGTSVRRMYRPLATVAGDVLTTERLSDTTLAISIADVSGHGVSAGMLTPMLKAALSAKSHESADDETLSPDDVLRRANRQLLALELDGGQFATALHARFDATAGRFEFARAGHPHPILLREGNSPRQMEAGGTALGVLDDIDCPVGGFDLARGDRVLVFSDGLEALILSDPAEHNATRLCETQWYKQLPSRTTDDILDDINARLDSACWNDATADDVSAIVLSVDV